METPLRTSYKVPYCPICKHEVDEFAMERDKDKGTITLIAKCHGTQEERTLKEHDIIKQDTDMFFNTLAHRSLKGRDMTHRIARGEPDERTKVNELLQKRFGKI